MPILNSLSTHTAVSRAKVTREIRELELQQAKNQVNETIKQAYFDANASKKKYDANVKAVDATKESFKYATKRYEVGNINGIEYNQSKTNLARAEADLVRAKYDYLFKFNVFWHVSTSENSEQNSQMHIFHQRLALGAWETSPSYPSPCLSSPPTTE